MFLYRLTHAKAHPHLGVGPLQPGLLSLREEAILTGLVHLPRRRKWLLGRMAAKALFKDHPTTRSVPSHTISVLNEPSGAPYALLGDTRWPYCLSLSHRQEVGLAVAGLESGEVFGADVERIELRDPALVRQFFTNEEAAWVGASGTEHAFRVSLIWSAKEAVLKALRLGLRIDTRTIEIDGLGASTTSVGWFPLQVKPINDPCILNPNLDLELEWRRETNFVLTVARLLPASKATLHDSPKTHP
jgi:4'-phosphopantetheinyl transferase